MVVFVARKLLKEKHEVHLTYFSCLSFKSQLCVFLLSYYSSVLAMCMKWDVLNPHLQNQPRDTGQAL